MQAGKNLKDSKKAMVFAAGLGTRLKPITNNKPKALAEINHIPLLDIIIRRLIQFGFHDIVVNVHHFSDQVVQFIRQKNNFGVNIMISDESDLLLDTGGGLQKARLFLAGKSPILLHNVDILTNLDYSKMEEYHLQQNALATVAVRNRRSSRYLLFDEDNQLCGWENTLTHEVKLPVPTVPLINLAFSGIHFVSPDIFTHLHDTGPYSVITKYLDLAVSSKIMGYIHNDDFWMDLGKPEHLQTASDLYNQYIADL